MDEQYSFRAGGSLLLSGSSPTVVKAKSGSEMLSSHLWRKTERKNVREGGGRLHRIFIQVICCFYEVVLLHISVMCLFCLAVLSLVQRLIAEDMNGQEFHFALRKNLNFY